jgi:CHASE3 domain sensor protein
VKACLVHTAQLVEVIRQAGKEDDPDSIRILAKYEDYKLNQTPHAIAAAKASGVGALVAMWASQKGNAIMEDLVALFSRMASASAASAAMTAAVSVGALLAQMAMTVAIAVPCTRDHTPQTDPTLSMGNWSYCEM